MRIKRQREGLTEGVHLETGRSEGCEDRGVVDDGGGDAQGVGAEEEVSVGRGSTDIRQSTMNTGIQGGGYRPERIANDEKCDVNLLGIP